MKREYTQKSSAEYIASLEAKLDRVKGRKQGNPSAAEMLNSLVALREDSMRRLTEDCFSPELEAFQTNDSTSSGFSVSLSKKLHPERQAVNLEETQALVDHDELEKQFLSINESRQDDEKNQSKIETSNTEN